MGSFATRFASRHFGQFEGNFEPRAVWREQMALVAEPLVMRELPCKARLNSLAEQPECIDFALILSVYRVATAFRHCFLNAISCGTTCWVLCWVLPYVHQHEKLSWSAWCFALHASGKYWGTREERTANSVANLEICSMGFGVCETWCPERWKMKQLSAWETAMCTWRPSLKAIMARSQRWKTRPLASLAL